MTGLSCEEAAARTGVDAAYVRDLIRLGIITRADGALTASDIRRIGLVRSLDESGLPLDELATGFATGLLSMDFVDRPEYNRFTALSGETFAHVAERAGVPLDLLLLIRETTGFGAAQAGSLMREDELRVVPFVQAQVQLGFEANAIERLLRAMGDNLRRIAEAEAEWWRSQVTEPRLQAGRSGSEVGDPGERELQLATRGTDALLAIFSAQQTQTWTYNITSGFRYLLANAGIHDAPERLPAICFLDITGYTRLTQERGDQAAAGLADQLAKLVKRSSLDHGGRPVKWLGDGVMCYFGHPSEAVLAALEMVDGAASAGLPPAHVGVHTGPVVIQEGDYYGQTVNMASRIADYARPGEVLVSAAVTAAAASEPRLSFQRIGAVELKGVVGTVELSAARRAERAAS